MLPLSRPFRTAIVPAIIAALGLSGCDSHSDRTTRRHSRIQWSSGLENRTMEISGVVEFTDDDRDVRSITPGGSLFLEDGNWLTSRRSYLVTADSHGSLSRTYRAGGRVQAMDAEARAWTGNLMLSLIRETGAGAKSRVDRIVHQGGPAAVLREVEEIRNDGSKSLYIRELLERNRLTDDQLRDVMRTVRTIGSDGDKTRLLEDVSAIYLKSGLRESWFAALGKVGADGDKRHGLEHAIRRDPTVETLVFAAKAGGEIGSDGDKAAVLASIGARGLEPAVLRPWLRSVESIGSDGDKAHVLSKSLMTSGGDSDTLVAILRAAETIGSDGDKKAVLVEAARWALTSEAVQRAFFAAASTIGSDGDRKAVLKSALRTPEASNSIAAHVAQTAKDIGSDSDKAAVLERVAELDMKDAAARSAFFTAVNTIGSDGDRARVLGTVLRSPALAPEMAVGAIEAATAIGSDGDKASLLMLAVERHAENPRVRASLEKALKSVHSDGDYRRISAALLR